MTLSETEIKELILLEDSIKNEIALKTKNPELLKCGKDWA